MKLEKLIVEGGRVKYAPIQQMVKDYLEFVSQTCDGDPECIKSSALEDEWIDREVEEFERIFVAELKRQLK